MKTPVALIVLFICSLGTPAVSAGPNDQLVTANTAFAFDLLNQVARAKPESNVFISPYSVSSALQMVENGAAGNTKTEMQRVLKTDGVAADSLNGAFADLNQNFTGRPDVTLTLANGLWVQNGFTLKPAFVEDDRKFFHAELTGVNFSEPQAAAVINGWADRNTAGKIKEVVQFPFPAATRMILANAIYLKAKWVTPFQKRLTRPRDFHPVTGPPEPRQMMMRDGRFEYQEGPGFQAVKLPYRGGLQMELYLPATNSSPLQFLGNLPTGKSWRDTIENGFGMREGNVVLPKFKFDYGVQLADALKALGMKDAFSSQADFSGMAEGRLSISAVKQNSYVDVDEAGTEAAAVTTVTMFGSAMPAPMPDRFTMILDRPFFFIISDQSTGSILFMGIMDDPPEGN